MKLIFGVILLIGAMAWGMFNYNHLRSEGVPHEKALFMALSSGMNSFVSAGIIIRMFSFQPDYNHGEGINLTSNIPPHNIEPANFDVHIDNTIENSLPPVSEPNYGIPWIAIIAGIGTLLLAPELLPFVATGF
jgi:hypothetical protein